VADLGKGRTAREPATRNRLRTWRAPRWAIVCSAIGSLLLLASGGALVTGQVLVSRYSNAVHVDDLLPDEGGDRPASDVKGPLDILLVGIDQRPNEPETLPRADSILILHIPAGMDRGYLVSLPRDLLVDIPAFPKAGYAGGQDKINAAMAFGSRVPGQPKPSTAQGFTLLAKTVSGYTGIQRFDAAAIISFVGFQKIVDAMGGVDLYVDTPVKSEHREPDGTMRSPRPRAGGYTGPQAEYPVGRHHLEGWQALDYVRQRYGLPNGDYDRQRHQQQFIKAMIAQAFSTDVVSNPVKLDRVLRAAGQAVTFDGQGNSVVEYALALKEIRASSVVTLKLPGESVLDGEAYAGERLQPPTQAYFAAVHDDRVDQFVIAHPDMVTK
jgi:polyisoprenyl-teichoic acid--peptidoglycan teichoic acid transferase